MIPNDLLVCESYIDGKMTKKSFTTKWCKAKECLELVYANMCEAFYVHI